MEGFEIKDQEGSTIINTIDNQTVNNILDGEQVCIQVEKNAKAESKPSFATDKMAQLCKLD